LVLLQQRFRMVRQPWAKSNWRYLIFKVTTRFIWALYFHLSPSTEWSTTSPTQQTLEGRFLRYRRNWQHGEWDEASYQQIPTFCRAVGVLDSGFRSWCEGARTNHTLWHRRLPSCRNVWLWRYLQPYCAGTRETTMEILLIRLQGSQRVALRCTWSHPLVSVSCNSWWQLSF
jgi:hypothetical protein